MRTRIMYIEYKGMEPTHCMQPMSLRPLTKTFAKNTGPKSASGQK